MDLGCCAIVYASCFDDSLSVPYVGWTKVSLQFETQVNGESSQRVGFKISTTKAPPVWGINLDASKYGGWFLREFPKIIPSGKLT